MNQQINPITHSLKEQQHLKGVLALLSWDQETYMPSGAIQARSEQQSLLAGIIHEKYVGSDFKSKLADCLDLETGDLNPGKWSPDDKVMLREIYKDWRMAQCLPNAFVASFTKLCSQAHYAWQEARKKNEFKIYQPYLEKIVCMSKEKADYLGWQTCRYDALLDIYEPGMTVAKIDPIFKRLRHASCMILTKIQGVSTIFSDLKTKPYDLQKQWDFSIKVLKSMGYDFKRGRQDSSAHPFTTELHPNDVRVTTRLSETDFMEAFSSSVHEGGHALYEQGLDQAFYGTPFCESVSLGIHESQSRLWEIYIAGSQAFWKGQYSHVQAMFPEALKEVSEHSFYRSINQINPSLIRVEADELTYNLHVMVRYEIEKAIFEGQVAVADLPALWNQKYSEYLGVTPPNNQLGILQDVHWSGGAFGYFPTYTLGNLYAAMMYKKLEQDLPTLEASIVKGEFQPIKKWLNKYVHQVGRRKSADELIRDLTGKVLSEESYLAHIKEKYSLIYGISL